MSSAELPLDKPHRVYRYPLIVRVAHWTNLLCLTILLMSGLQIFNAHPALYWGEDSDFDRPFAALGAFPGWLTIPSVQDLATGRVWHFFFGWLFVIMTGAEGLTQRVQRALLWRGSLAREYRRADISPVFRANGSQDAGSLPPGYVEAAQRGYPDWRLHVDGLVNTPSTFTLQDIRRLPSRTQITRHDCVEGWSCIGGWTGLPLSVMLERVGLEPEARFVVFHCADELPSYTDGRNLFYESLDLIDAYHPQTILAYDLNGAPLDVAHGAPLRLRVERQLGYKMAKFLNRIEVVARLDTIRGGRGGTWEDNGYEWYAGI